MAYQGQVVLNERFSQFHRFGVVSLTAHEQQEVENENGVGYVRKNYQHKHMRQNTGFLTRQRFVSELSNDELESLRIRLREIFCIDLMDPVIKSIILIKILCYRGFFDSVNMIKYL